MIQLKNNVWASAFYSQVIKDEFEETKISPAGTGTVTVFFCFVWPLPPHSTQGLVISLPVPPHLRQVDLITNGPVEICSWQNIGYNRDGFEWQQAYSPSTTTKSTSRYLRARFVSITMTSLTCIHQLDVDLFVDSFCCFIKSKIQINLKKILKNKRWRL